MSGLLVVAATDRELHGIEGADCLRSGIGPVEAALATARALAAGRYGAVLHLGIAGAVELAAPAIVIGSEAVYCDVLDPGATLPRVSRAAAAAALVDAARGALPEASVMPIATAARVGGGDGWEVEAMEGFGVLRAAELAGVPALELRVICNRVSEVDRSRWLIDDALQTLRGAVARLIPVLRGLIETDDPLDRIRAELLAREPIFHKPELGTRREDYLAMTAEDFWEVGASGRVYDRDGVLSGLVARGKVPGDEHWVLSDTRVRRLSADTYAFTYHLDQAGRLTRRLTLWRRDPDGWRILYHQGTLIAAT